MDADDKDFERERGKERQREREIDRQTTFINSL